MIKAINIVIAAALIATIITAALYRAKVASISRQLESTNEEMESVRKSLERSRSECTILKEDSKRVQAIIGQYTHAIESKQTEYVDRCNAIQNDETAVDWLSTPLPDSIRLLYGCTCDGD